MSRTFPPSRVAGGRGPRSVARAGGESGRGSVGAWCASYVGDRFASAADPSLLVRRSSRSARARNGRPGPLRARALVGGSRNATHGHGSRPASGADGPDAGAGRETHRMRTFVDPRSNTPESRLGAGRATVRIRTFRAPRPHARPRPGTRDPGPATSPGRTRARPREWSASSAEHPSRPQQPFPHHTPDRRRAITSGSEAVSNA